MHRRSIQFHKVGETLDAHSVFVNGKQITLRENLALILRNLRHKSETEVGHLGVDAISINQDNVTLSLPVPPPGLQFQCCCRI